MDAQASLPFPPKKVDAQAPLSFPPKKVDVQAPLPFPHCYVPVLRLFIELQNLIKDLKSELGGDLLKVVLACMIPPAEFDARELNKAMEVRPLRTLPPIKKNGGCMARKKNQGWVFNMLPYPGFSNKLLAITS